MTCPKLFPKLFSCYSHSLSVSKAIVHCSCRLLHIQQSLKVNVKLNSLALQYRHYSDIKGSSDEDAEKSQDTKIASGGLRNYKVFEDFDSPVILDIDEERRLLEENPEYLQEMQKRERGDRFFGMNLSRKLCCSAAALKCVFIF